MPVSVKLSRSLVLAATLGSLLLILLIALHLRTQGMFPISDALLYDNDYDEGVNIAAGQLLLQGYVPYRDYFYVHPPLAVLIFAGVARIHFVPWGDATTFVYERYAAITCGLLTVLGVFVLTRQLGGTLSGLVAAGLLAVDGLVVEIDRRAMLEPYVNALSLLAILCYLGALRRERSRTAWLIMAGAVGAAVALVKTPGVLVLATLLTYAGARVLVAWLQTRVLHDSLSSGDSVRARFLELAKLLAGAALVAVLVLGYFLLTNPISFIKQVYVFQLLRPADGPASVAERVSEILGYDTSHLTLYLAGLGLGLLILRGMLRRRWGQWGLILLWTAAIVVLLAWSRTYYAHYFLQLAEPLSILGGGLVSREQVDAIPASVQIRSSGTYRAVLAAQVAFCLFAVTTNWGPAQTQYAAAEAVSTFQTTLLRDISRVLATRTSPSGSIIVFHPASALAASRKMVGPGEGQFMIDSYGYMQYITLGLEEEWAPDSSSQGLMDLLHGEDAQARVEEIAGRADYILFEHRAGWQLNPETIDAMTRGYHLIYTKGKVSLFGKN